MVRLFVRRGGTHPLRHRRARPGATSTPRQVRGEIDAAESVRRRAAARSRWRSSRRWRPRPPGRRAWRVGRRRRHRRGAGAARRRPTSSPATRRPSCASRRCSRRGSTSAARARPRTRGSTCSARWSSPDGLVMIWNSHISSARMTEMMEAAGRSEGMGIQVVPRSFTVMLPEGEVPALLAATDSALDLAFLQLERPPAQPLAFVDFARAARPAVGDALLAVSRLGRGFDHAPRVQTARVGGAAQEAARGVHRRRRPDRVRAAGVRPRRRAGGRAHHRGHARRRGRQRGRRPRPWGR